MKRDIYQKDVPIERVRKMKKRISEEPQMGCRVRGAGWISLVLMHSAVLPY